MTKLSNGERSFRRWISQLFTSLIKRQNGEIEDVLERLQEIKESIDIIARDIARQKKER